MSDHSCLPERRYATLVDRRELDYAQVLAGELDFTG
jgi:hypothetical protein